MEAVLNNITIVDILCLNKYTCFWINSPILIFHFLLTSEFEAFSLILGIKNFPIVWDSETK